MSRSCNLVERSIEDLSEPFNFTRSPGYTRSRSQTFLRDHTNNISIDHCRKLDKTPDLRVGHESDHSCPVHDQYMRRRAPFDHVHGVVEILALAADDEAAADKA